MAGILKTPIFSPKDLRRISDEKDMKEARDAFAAMKEAEDKEKALRDAFMQREVLPDAMDRLMAAVKAAAEHGRHELLIVRFPSKLLTDGGRRVNNFQHDWPESLQGFGQRAFDFYKEHLAPLGFRLRAEILDYPGGNLGDVGLTLTW